MAPTLTFTITLCQLLATLCSAIAILPPQNGSNTWTGLNPLQSNNTLIHDDLPFPPDAVFDVEAVGPAKNDAVATWMACAYGMYFTSITRPFQATPIQTQFKNYGLGRKVMVDFNNFAYFPDAPKIIMWGLEGLLTKTTYMGQQQIPDLKITFSEPSMFLTTGEVVARSATRSFLPDPGLAVPDQVESTYGSYLLRFWTPWKAAIAVFKYVLQEDPETVVDFREKTFMYGDAKFSFNPLPGAPPLMRYKDMAKATVSLLDSLSRPGLGDTQILRMWITRPGGTILGVASLEGTKLARIGVDTE